jgi:hypothetical protein
MNPCRQDSAIKIKFMLLQFFRNSLRPMTSQTRMTSQRNMQSNTGTGVGMPAAGKSGSARLGSTYNNTLSSTGASDWSSSVDSRPPRASAATNGRSAASQRIQSSGNKQQVKFWYRIHLMQSFDLTP